MTGDNLNQLALVLGMIGAAMLYRWGPPQPSFDERSVLLLEDSGANQPAEDARGQRRRYSMWSRAGLSLLFISFALQLAATFLV